MARVTVTGGTGVLGRVLVPGLRADGHEVTVLTRRPAAEVAGSARWMAGELASGGGLGAAVGGAEVVVHLASRPVRPARVGVGGGRAPSRAGARAGGGAPPGGVSD